ncbi:MAG: DNA internalization-related competence protein ComEC/Rec2 [Ghiorsea sp.]|nr:DNA internalization-related competence protein ComEC/Rec2 [Ghiorsea sp.]
MGTLFTLLKSAPLLLPSLAWVLGLSLACLDVFSWFYMPLLLPLLWWWRQTWLYFLLAGFVFGVSSLAWQTSQLDVDNSWFNQKINIQATIDDVRQTAQYTRLKLDHIQRDDGQVLNAKINVYVYHHGQILLPDMDIKLRVKLHQPRNKKNPTYFDYEQYLFHQGVALVGSVSGKVEIINHHISWLEQGRQKIRHVLTRLDDDQQGILLALLLADRSRIPLDIDDAFAASGATHLLAISGLHMGLVAGWGFILAWWLITRRESWIVRFPVRTFALTAGMLLAFVYALLAGFPIPAQRAFLMLLAAVLAWSLRATLMPLNTMFAALMLITLIDPASVLSVSLWLSFTATSALLIWAERQPKVESMYAKAWMWLKGMFWVSIIASLATLPLIGYVFERLPAWSLLANTLLVPLYAFWVLPLALLGEFFALWGGSSWAVHIFEWSGWGISWGNQVLLWIHTLPAGSLWLRGDLPWLYVLFAVFFLLSGSFWYKTKRWVSASVLLISLGLYAVVMLGEAEVKQAQLYVWDVGQGASSLLVLPDFKLLIDVSGKRGSKFNGGTIAAQNMRHLGWLHADAVLLSHAQSDHAGGIKRLLASLNGVHELWLADVPKNHAYFAEVMNKMPVRWLKKGDNFDIKGKNHVKVLWPPQGYAPRNNNNTSLVLEITLITGQKLLFAGDMEAPVEWEILNDIQPVDVMLMPHHGSKTSSTPAFVDKVQPKIVIAQTGYKNHYGFPKAEVVKRYQNRGANIINTADGAVHIVFERRWCKFR